MAIWWLLCSKKSHPKTVNSAFVENSLPGCEPPLPLRTAAPWGRWLLQVLVMFFTIVIGIVLVNLLIAIMGNPEAPDPSQTSVNLPTGFPRVPQ